MPQSPFFTVVVPVYNGHAYLRECLDSVRHQTFSDFEVIMVDDGSVDDSPAICAEYAEADVRFKLVENRLNQGASAARNAGISRAEGTYLLFLDNDDWWGRDDALEHLHAVAEAQGKPDVICYWMGDFWPNSGTLNLEDTKHEAKINGMAQVDDALAYLMANQLWYSSACGKAMRADLMRDFMIYFDETLKANEDTELSVHLMCRLRSLAWSDRTFYVYRRASDTSQSAVIGEREVDDLRQVLDNTLAVAGMVEMSDKRLNLVMSFLAYIWVLLVSYLNLPENLRWSKERLAAARTYDWLLRFDADPRVRTTRRTMKIAGWKACGVLLGQKMAKERRALSKR